MIEASDRGLYERDHGRRPGAVVRDDRYWDARAGWLAGEGWEVLKHQDADGYCYARATDGGGQVDEASGECVEMLRRRAPGAGEWVWRAPADLTEALGDSRERESWAMVLPMRSGLSVDSLASPAAALWATDEF